MGRFLLRRLFAFFVTLLAVITVSFFLMRAVRGGPFDEDRALHPAAKAAIEQAYHLDWPIWKQYIHYLGGILVLDFGPSFRMRDATVNDVLAQAFPNSAMLGLCALFFALTLGMGAGVAAARRPGGWADRLLLPVATLGQALPNFLVAGALIVFFSFYLPLFPPAGWAGPRNLVLPALALGLPFAASIARLTRAGMLEVMGQDFLRTAKAKGLTEGRILWRHAIQGGLFPVTSYLGPAAAGILTGSLVIEKIFAIPGLGQHFINSALNRDYTLAMGITVLYTCLVYGLNTLVDVVYALLDPRVELS